jgi:formate hydrogenlyase subunit 6/NADH:ubiquinone oxidoreductase subunit I
MKKCKNGKKVAKINDKNCIKCYCCQELCPHGAVKIHKNFILKIAEGLGK